MHRIASAIGSRDVTTVLAATDPAVEWHAAMSLIMEGGAYQGHEGIRRYFDDFDEAFESFDVHLDDALEVGDLVVGVGRLHYRGRASGLETTLRLGWVFRFKAGLVVYLRSFQDPEQVLGVAGIPPE